MASITEWKTITQKRIDGLKEDPNSDNIEELFNELNAIKSITSDIMVYRKIEKMSKKELDEMYKDVLTYSISKACEDYQDKINNSNDPQVFSSSMNKISDIQKYLDNINELNLSQDELKELLLSVLVSVETKEYLNGKEIYETAVEIKKESEEDNNKDIETEEVVNEPVEKEFNSVLKLALADLKDTDEYSSIVALKQRQEEELKNVTNKQESIKTDRDRVKGALSSSDSSDMTDEDYEKLKVLAEEFPYDPDKVVKELEETYKINLGWFKKSNAKPIIDKITSFIEYKEKETKLDKKISTLPNLEEIEQNQLASRNEKSVPLYMYLKERLTREGFGDDKYLDQIKIDDGDYLDKLSSLELKNDAKKRTYNNYDAISELSEDFNSVDVGPKYK